MVSYCLEPALQQESKTIDNVFRCHKRPSSFKEGRPPNSCTNPWVCYTAKSFATFVINKQILPIAPKVSTWLGGLPEKCFALRHKTTASRR